jgi:hypothetical protein
MSTIPIAPAILSSPGGDVGEGGSALGQAYIVVK